MLKQVINGTRHEEHEEKQRIEKSLWTYMKFG
jgi:hypothetical protein